MIGNQLEESGWKQGSVLRENDISCIVDAKNIPCDNNSIFLVASQSCDIANNNAELEPYIEVSLARPIDRTNGNYAHNKNPRILHTQLMYRTNDSSVFSDIYIELKAFEKFLIKKEVFKNLKPDLDRILSDRQLKSYVAWLAARYSRPALPTEFNNRIDTSIDSKKLKDKVKKIGTQLLGIYVEITPDAEIKENESYNVNLLGLLPAGFSGDLAKIEDTLDAYQNALKKAGMEVKSALLTEDEVSLATINRFKRFYYDDLSFKEKTPLPPEVDNIF